MDVLDIDLPADLADDLDGVHEQYQRLGLAELSDNEVFDLAARIVAVPKRDPANSFCLHAPLEVLARRALLGFVRPGAGREAVRERMLWVAAKYRAMAESAAAAPVREFSSPIAAAETLLAAIERGELADVDAAVAWLAAHGSDATVLGLVPAVVDRLAAAGHASIYFALLERTPAAGGSARALLAPLAHELARAPQLRIEWVRDDVATGGASGADLAAALAATPRLGRPGSNFIFPLVHQVDGPFARELLEHRLPHDIDAATRAITRVAAISMLQDDPESAPYGWTHCLTLPLGVLANVSRLADPALGVAIAATYVAGFRAGLGAHALDLEHIPEPVAGRVMDALDDEPARAAAAVAHAPATDTARLVAELAVRGGGHEDAHVAKYTLACFDAAARDPGRVSLYLAAVAYLQAWWRYSAPEPVD